MRLALSLSGRGGIGRDKRHDLTDNPAERTLIAAMAARRMLARRAVVVDVGAEFSSVAEKRLELGGDGRVIGAGEVRGRQRWGRRGGEQLNNERECDKERGQRRANPRRAQTSPDAPAASFWGHRRPRRFSTSSEKRTRAER